MTEVIDLDVLRPKRTLFKLNDEEIDVSYIPTGMTFDIDDVIQRMAALNQKKIAAGDTKELRKAFDLGVELCSVFCQWKHPEMTLEWFMEYTTAVQVRNLGEAVKVALSHAYDGIEVKNAEAVQVT